VLGAAVCYAVSAVVTRLCSRTDSKDSLGFVGDGDFDFGRRRARRPAFRLPVQRARTFGYG